MAAQQAQRAQQQAQHTQQGAQHAQQGGRRRSGDLPPRLGSQSQTANPHAADTTHSDQDVRIHHTHPHAQLTTAATATPHATTTATRFLAPQTAGTLDEDLPSPGMQVRAVYF